MPLVRRGDVGTTTITVLGARKRRALVGGVAVTLLALSLGGCSTSIADLPFGSSDGSKDVSAYPAVHDMPAPRDDTPLAPAEQAKVEQELIAARDHQTPPAAATTTATK